MSTGQRAGVIGAVLLVIWIGFVAAVIAHNQSPPPGAADAESLRAGVEDAVRAGDVDALQNELPPGEVGEDYAAELLARLPEDASALRARLDHEDGTEIITVFRAGSSSPCVHWAVVVIEDRNFLDPVPVTTACRP